MPQRILRAIVKSGGDAGDSNIRSNKPEGVAMKSILDRSFRYTPSSHTDVRKTFARIRREHRQAVRTGQPLADSVNVPRLGPRRVTK